MNKKELLYPDNIPSPGSRRNICVTQASDVVQGHVPFYVLVFHVVIDCIEVLTRRTMMIF